jgi:nicotinamidase-related amidase
MLLKKALIIVDMQEDYVGENRNKKIHSYDVATLIENINKKIKEYSQNGYVVIFVRNVAKEKCSDIVDGLNLINDFIFDKSKASCFSNADLLDLLAKSNITDIEFAGIDGNSCVGISALESIKRGFNTTFIFQCVGVKNVDKFEKMRTRLLNAGVNISYA